MTMVDSENLNTVKQVAVKNSKKSSAAKKNSTADLTSPTDKADSTNYSFSELEYRVTADFSVYYNDPQTGYRTVGNPVTGLESAYSDGFVAEFHQDGGYAISYSHRKVGGRNTQFNVAMRWYGFLPLGCADDIFKIIRDYSVEHVGSWGCDVKCGFFPTADPEVVSQILDAIKMDYSLSFDEKDYPDAMRVVKAALYRLPIPAKGITIGLPLPNNKPLSKINVYPMDPYYSPGAAQMGVRMGKISGQRADNRRSDVAHIIATAESEVVRLAVNYNSIRVYEIHDSLKCGKTLHMQESDRRIFDELLWLMNDTMKEQVIFERLFSKTEEPRAVDNREVGAARRVSNEAESKKGTRSGSYDELSLPRGIIAIILFIALLITAALFCAWKFLPEKTLSLSMMHVAIILTGIIWITAVAIIFICRKVLEEIYDGE